MNTKVTNKTIEFLEDRISKIHSKITCLELELGELKYDKDILTRELRNEIEIEQAKEILNRG